MARGNRFALPLEGGGARLNAEYRALRAMIARAGGGVDPEASSIRKL
jgi:hypothetical protein